MAYRIVRLVRFVAIAAFFVGSFWLITNKTETPKPAKAGALSNLAVSVSGNTKNSTGTYTIAMTNATAIPANGSINVEFYGPNSWSFNFYNTTKNSATTPSSLYINNRNSNAIYLATSSEIAANTNISIVLDSVGNPSQNGYYFAHAWTSNYGKDIDGSSSWGGDYKSAYFEIGSNTNMIGTVTDGNNDPVPFTYVSIYSSNYSSNSYSYYNSYTDKDGKYGFGDVSAGTYNFYVWVNAYNSGTAYISPSTTTVTIPESGVTTKNVAFEATPKVMTGKITRNSATGAAVTDASVSVWRSGYNGGYASTTTDSNGNYTFHLPQGTWTISIYPQYWDTADWDYSVWNESITFTNDTSTETKTKNIYVDTLSSTVTGLIQKPDGSALAQYAVGINFSNSKNRSFYTYPDTNGNFSKKVTPSSYSVNGWVSDSNFSMPKIENFSVGDGETKNLGTIKLVEKTDTISGTIADDTGGTVSGAYVSAWKNDGTWDYAYTNSASDGTYTMKVVPGTWQVSAWPAWTSTGYDYINNGKPESVTVTSGVTAIKNFTFKKCNATITGTIIDPDGNIITTMSPWISAGDGSQDWGNVGTTANAGYFTLKVPAGKWTVSAYLWGVDYSNPEPQEVTIAANETKSITLQAVKNDSTISGTVYDDSGNKITDKWISIYASKGKYGSWQNATFDTATAAYSMKVSAGTWNLGWWIDQSLGYNSGSGVDNEVTIASGEAKTYDIILKKNDSQIKGKTYKSDGSVYQWVWVTADSRDPNEKKSADTYYWSNGTSSNNSGEYTLNVPSGTYWIGANTWYGSGYINPKRVKVTVDKDNSANVDMTFRQADGTISGTVSKEGSNTSAFVTAWSEDGGYSEANANNEGVYGLSVSSGTKWHVSAVKMVDKEIWKSNETVVDLSDTKTTTQNLELKKKDFTMPDAVSITIDPTKNQTVELDDNTTLTIPANTLADSGTVTLDITPTANLAEESDAKPLSYGYEMTATDNNGQAIETFPGGSITIEQSYEQEWLDDSNVLDENELSPAYYDESAGTWQALTNVTVSEDENTISYQTNHFTKFAIITASDTTPPSAPTSQSATAGDGKVTLGWTNPTEGGLSGINIYRSTTSGTLGSKVHSAVTGTSKEDTGLTNGTTYYYTLKAVDASSNESVNTAQVSATPQAGAVSTSTLPKTGRPSVTNNALTGVISVIILFGIITVYKVKKSY